MRGELADQGMNLDYHVLPGAAQICGFIPYYVFTFKQKGILQVVKDTQVSAT